jgi:hypothetical protein
MSEITGPITSTQSKKRKIGNYITSVLYFTPFEDRSESAFMFKCKD